MSAADTPPVAGLWMHAMLEEGVVVAAHAIRDVPVSYALQTPTGEVLMRAIAGYDSEQDAVVHRLEQAEEAIEEVVEVESPNWFTVEREGEPDRQFAVWYHEGDVDDLTVPDAPEGDAA